MGFVTGRLVETRVTAGCDYTQDRPRDWAVHKGIAQERGVARRGRVFSQSDPADSSRREKGEGIGRSRRGSQGRPLNETTVRIVREVAELPRREI
jgi:hypothetical protein